MVCHHQISSPCEYRRMMCPEPLEFTWTSLATCCTSLCNSSSRNLYSLNKGMLVKYQWFLVSTSWMTPTSSPSTSHLHMSNGKLSFNAVSLRCKHNLETLFTFRKILICDVNAFIGNARQLIPYIKLYATKFFILF